MTAAASEMHIYGRNIGTDEQLRLKMEVQSAITLCSRN
jgi:hypothetical protein